MIEKQFKQKVIYMRAHVSGVGRDSTETVFVSSDLLFVSEDRWVANEANVNIKKI